MISRLHVFGGENRFLSEPFAFNTAEEETFLDNKMMTSGRFGCRFLLVIMLKCSCLRVEGAGS